MLRWDRSRIWIRRASAQPSVSRCFCGLFENFRSCALATLGLESKLEAHFALTKRQRNHAGQSIQNVHSLAASDRCAQKSGLFSTFCFLFCNKPFAQINGTDYPLVNIPLMNSTKVFGASNVWFVCLQISIKKNTAKIGLIAKEDVPALKELYRAHPPFWDFVIKRLMVCNFMTTKKKKEKLI